MAGPGEQVEDFAQMRCFPDRNASFPISNFSFSPRAGFDSSSEAKENSELQKKASGQPRFCALCGRTFNSKFQTQQHMRSKAHVKKMKHLSNTSSFSTSGLNQNTLHDEISNERTHKTFGKAKRMVDDTEMNWQSKKPKLFRDTASQPKCVQRHLYKQLHYKAPLAVLNEYEKGLEINVYNRQDISPNPSFTASLQLDGKTYGASGNSKRMAEQLLAETVISQMDQDIEEMQVKRAAVRLAFQNKDETEEYFSTADQEVLQRPPPFDTDTQSSDLTSNHDIYSSTASSTFDSVYMSASDQQFESNSSMAPTSDNRKLQSEANIENTGSDVSSAEILTFKKGNAKQHYKIKRKRTAVAILSSLVPGINWNVMKKSRIKVGSPLKEFVVSINVNGENFEGCSSAKHLARQYAAEAALNKLFGLEFEQDNVGMPLFHGYLAEIANLKKRKLKNANFLDTIDGKKPIIALKELFKNEITFQYRSHLAPERGLMHYCAVSVAGMTIECSDSLKKNAKNRAAFAAVAVLRANGMYDQKVAKRKARCTGMPVQQMVVKQKAPSSAISVRSTPAARTKSRPLSASAISRLNRVFPGSRFTFRAEKVDLKGKIFTVDVLIGEQRFVGNGKKLRSAQVRAAKKALRAFGFWTDLDDNAEGQLHVGLLSEIEKKNQGFHLTITPADAYFDKSFHQPVRKEKKKLAKSQGNKGSTAHGIKRNSNSIAINSSYFGTEDDDNLDIIIGGNYYGTGNKQARLMGSGAERGSDENSNVLIGSNYYDSADGQVRFMCSETERRNDNSNDILIDANFYDTGDNHASFVGSKFSFAGRNEGSVSNVNSDINYRLWNIACGISTGSSVSAVEAAYQNNDYDWRPFSS